MKGAHTMRIAHFSDLHFGAKTLSEADRCFGAAIDRAIAAGAQAAVISGDATDHALDLHAPAAARLAAQVRRLADGCPVLMLQGTYSHEPPGTLDVFRSIGGKHPIHVADSIQQVALTGRGGWVRSPSWQFESLPADTVALFSCLPTVNKATVAAAVGAAQAASAVGEHLGRLLAGFGPANRLARSAGLPTIGVSHGTVFGSVSEHGVPMAGFDHEFTTGALFAAETQAFMLGHIHRHQSWEQDSKAGRQLVAYAGSIGRFHYGEDGDKGFLRGEVDATRASATLVPTPARRTVDIVFEGRPDLSVLREALAQQDVAGASVRVRWTVGEEDRSAVDRDAIQRMLGDAAETKLEGRIVPVVRTRAAGISRLPRLADKLRAWARVTDVNAEPLLMRLAELGEHSPEDIAERLLHHAGPSSDLEPMSDGAALPSHETSTSPSLCNGGARRQPAPVTR